MLHLKLQVIQHFELLSHAHSENDIEKKCDHLALYVSARSSGVLSSRIALIAAMSAFSSAF